MAQGRTQKFFFTGFWHFIEFCLYFLQQFNNDVLKYSWDWFCFKHLGECSCQKTSFCHVFPHQLGARDIALKAVCGLGSLKAHGGKPLPQVLDFYAEFFQPSVLHVFLWVQVCATAFLFSYGGICSEERMHFLKMKLNKVSYKISHLFSILRHFFPSPKSVFFHSSLLTVTLFLANW